MSDQLMDDVVALAGAAAPRVLLGLAGPPGAGKSTLARALVAGVDRRLGARTAAYVPMDGFHLSNAQLDLLGRRGRKGAPDTFDVHGYLALLRRLATPAEHVVYVPDYDRELHEPVAGRLAVASGVRLIVTEGNYLASDAFGWREARGLLDELWYVDAPDDVREQRLTVRQRAGGLGAEGARAWVENTDRPNGEFVKGGRGNCSRTVSSLSGSPTGSSTDSPTDSPAGSPKAGRSPSARDGQVGRDGRGGRDGQEADTSAIG
jgi:pantothenate kinase